MCWGRSIADAGDKMMLPGHGKANKRERHLHISGRQSRQHLPGALQERKQKDCKSQGIWEFAVRPCLLRNVRSYKDSSP